MKLKTILNLPISIFLLSVMLSFTGCMTHTTDPAYGQYMRPGEDPGSLPAALLSNYQHVTNITIQGSEVLRVQGAMTNDTGDGNIQYPYNFQPKVLDINEVVISADSSWVYFYIAFANRYYVSRDYSAAAPGFQGPYIGIFFGKTNNSPASTNFCMNSPGDTGNRSIVTSMGPGFYTTNVDVQVGIGLIGTTFPNFGCVINEAKWNVFDNSQILSYVTTNDLFRTSVIYPTNISTVFAFRVSRTNALAAGNWKMVMFTWGWEDYGQATSCPGNNGYLRTITSFPGSWTFGYNGLSGNASACRCADLLCKYPTNQVTILTNKVINGSDMFDVTLP